jgi:Putative rhamnosyl transferase
VPLNHLLLTRFNLPINYARRPGQHGDRAWLEHRWALFQEYCIPSVLGQTNHDFIWIIFCWDGTPEWYRARLDGLTKSDVRVEVAYLSTSTSGEHLPRLATQRGFDLGPYLLTTRLDNDDAIATSYMETVRYAAQRERRRGSELPRVLNTPVGYQLSRGKPYLRVDTKGPFVSMLERAETGRDLSTILAVSHRELAHVFSSRQVWTLPSWLQVLHGENLANELLGLRVPAARALWRFPVPRPEPGEETKGERVLDVIRTGAGNGARGSRVAVRNLRRAARRVQTIGRSGGPEAPHWPRRLPERPGRKAFRGG